MILVRRDKFIYLGFIAAVTVSFFVFYNSFYFQVWQPSGKRHWISDIPVHTQFILDFSTKGSFPVYTVWYKLVQILSGFSSRFEHLAFITIMLLAALVGIKYLISYFILITNNAKKIDSKLVALLSFGLLVIMPILSYYPPDKYPNQVLISKFHIYLGNIAANQWHNSTLTLAMPVYLLLYYYSLNHFKSDKLYPFFIISALAVISIFCKPNYALAFIPVLCLALLIFNLRLGQYREAIVKPAIIALPILVTLFYQWYFTFVQNDLFDHSIGTKIAPFLVWKTYSPHIFISLILSIAFPLTVLIFFYKKIDQYVLMAWLTFLVALGMFSFLAEYPMHNSANYLWGSIAANYILFLFSLKLLLNQSSNWKAKTAYCVLGLHFFSGCFLLIAFLIKQKPLIL
ncbi:Uncharacterised protein [Legionella beliardensis]|uniref:Glycosyltransferase RgtA/B/C/D-like domain-containing protein n=1 Tax=Legionella beliardensis TaxID=91822 RepID=A0A378I505_9GAMM|nr:hypothetical protein [Legionella beliardensis]STX29751.1 Uncharacterised protein [Legionella beliardensis]